MNNTLRNFYAFNGIKKSYGISRIFFSPLCRLVHFVTI